MIRQLAGDTKHGTQKARGVSLFVRVLLGATVALVMASATFAQEIDVSARLVRIKSDVAATEKVLATLKAEFKRLKGEEKTLASEIDKLTFEERALVERSAQVAKEREELATQVREAERKVEEEQVAIRARLRSIYVNSYARSPGAMLASAQTEELERIAVYAAAVRRNDERRFREVKLAVEQLMEARRRLDTSLDEGKRLQAVIQTKRTELELQREKLQGVLRQIQEKQQRARASLALLTGEAAKLEELLQSLTGGAGIDNSSDVAVDKPPAIDSPAGPVVSTPSDEKQPTSKVDASPDRRFEEVAHPQGLFGKSVRVVLPVKGDVLQRFGKTKVADFSDMIFSKGLEYKTAEGSQVRAILGGRVAFAGIMPGYETVVIIDHGARSYSLYGRLGKSFVKQGDVIAQKEAIGVTSTPDERGRNFYFETRKNGAPVDPSGVLSRAS
jgi:septal ring factor EnvC (AmiA/AmiB activator)